MKSLLTFFTLSLSLTFTFSLFGQDKQPLYHLSKDKIDIEFTTAYTFYDIVELKEKLAKEDIELTYQSLQFSKNGRLKQVSATIKTPNETVASFTSRELQPTDKSGFHLDACKAPFRKE